MAKKAEQSPLADLGALVDALRAAGVAAYEGPVPGFAWDVHPDGPGNKQHVKLTLHQSPPTARPVTGKVVGPAPARAPNPVPKDLEAAGVDADQLAEAQARAALLFPS